MTRIARFFLTAKSRTIFGGLVAIWTISVIPFASLSAVPDQSGAVSLGFALTFCGLMLLGLAFMIGWFWSMGSFLNDAVELGLRRSTNFFWFSAVFPLLYAPIFTVFMTGQTGAIMAFVIPLHVLATFCMFYDIYFVAKGLAIVECGRSVKFYDYSGPFFLLWFFPIGVWFIQPRINQLYSERATRAAPVL